MNNRRKHSKVEVLPPEIVEAVNRKLTVEHFTYTEIAEWLNKLGHEVSKSAIGRYGKDFLSRLERLKVVQEQAKAIVSANPDSPATEMAEAANKISMQLITETLMSVNKVEGEKITEVFKALAHLERSAVAREKLKLEFGRGVDAAASRIKTALRTELAAHPDLIERLAAIVDEQAGALGRSA